MLRGSTGNSNCNFNNALTTLQYYEAKQLTQLFIMNIITQAFRAQVQHIHYYIVITTRTGKRHIVRHEFEEAI